MFAADVLQVFQLAGGQLSDWQRLSSLLHRGTEVITDLSLAQQLLKYLGTHGQGLAGRKTVKLKRSVRAIARCHNEHCQKPLSQAPMFVCFFVNS